MKPVNPEIRRELLASALLLAVLNLQLLTGGPALSLVFFPDAVAGGEWWRVLTHPFVHLTWYHLFLDAGACLLLYGGLYEERRSRRLALAAASCAGSLLVPLLASPRALAHGLCGLSGMAHGLMAFSGLELLSRPGVDRRERAVGLLGFGIVVAKSIVEAWTGSVVFTFLHFGLMGLPVALCHAGGVLGGLLAFAAFRRRDPDTVSACAPLAAPRHKAGLAAGDGARVPARPLAL